MIFTLNLTRSAPYIGFILHNFWPFNHINGEHQLSKIPSPYNIITRRLHSRASWPVYLLYLCGEPGYTHKFLPFSRVHIYDTILIKLLGFSAPHCFRFYAWIGGECGSMLAQWGVPWTDFMATRCIVLYIPESPSFSIKVLLVALNLNCIIRRPFTLSPHEYHFLCALVVGEGVIVCEGMCICIPITRTPYRNASNWIPPRECTHKLVSLAFDAIIIINHHYFVHVTSIGRFIRAIYEDYTQDGLLYPPCIWQPTWWAYFKLLQHTIRFRNGIRIMRPCAILVIEFSPTHPQRLCQSGICVPTAVVNFTICTDLSGDDILLHKQ